MRALTLGVVIGGLAASGATAQAWLGQVAGDVAGRSLQESVCRAGGRPAPQALVERATVKADGLVADYAQAAAAGDRAAMRKLFLHPGKPSWFLEQAPVLPGAIADPFAGSGADGNAVQPAAFERFAFAVTRDGYGARGRWKAVRPSTSAGDVAREVEYMVDFSSSSLTGGWKILRMRLYANGETVYGPSDVCHLNQAPSLWPAPGDPEVVENGSAPLDPVNEAKKRRRW